MPLFSPQLDDRSFDQLMEEAKRRAVQSCPEWTDFSPSDPGVVLLELFAYLTESMIYRLNRLPQKAYVEFLRLMGVALHPPCAARVTLRFSRTESSGANAADVAPQRITIPPGTRVACAASQSDGKPPEFLTIEPAVLEPNQDAVEVTALHCDEIQGELIGYGSGHPALSLRVSRPPILAPAGDDHDFVLGVEIDMDEVGDARSRRFSDKTFQIWSEVDSFAALGAYRNVFVVDRMEGRVTFATAVMAYGNSQSTRPVALADIPPEGREIRVWYRRGGGTAGNVAPGTVTVLKDSIPGVVVSNPAASTGGREGEPLANALIRGPQELHSLSRAVTARDYEQLAMSTGGIARARAFTMAQVWRHAEPGTVQVLIVPDVAGAKSGERVTLGDIEQNQTDEAARRLLQLLDERRPLGTNVLVNWMRYKVVRVRAQITTFRGEDLAGIEQSVRQRLDQVVSPLPNPLQPDGWPFDRTLRVGRLYDEIFKEPGVKQVDRLRLIIDDVPNDPVRSLAADCFQPATWHAISGNALYRTTDNGEVWETAGPLPDFEENEELRTVKAHPGRAGFVAVISRIVGNQRSGRVYVSEDCGESWRVEFRTGFEIFDLAWILRDNDPAMFVATDNGLFERGIGPGAQLRQIVVGNLPSDLGFWTVAVTTDLRHRPVNVAVAAEESKGVWISYEGGESKSFLPIGLEGQDIRVLTVQYDGSRSLLWAGAAVVGNQPGKGGYRWGGPNEDWQQFQTGWRGGSCYGLAVCGRYVLAATYGGGVLRMDSMRKSEEMRWETPNLDNGLPRRDEVHPFAPIRNVVADPDGRVVLAGGDSGVFRSSDQGLSFESVSRDEFTDSVAIANTSLFCAGDHEIVVVHDGTGE